MGKPNRIIRLFRSNVTVNKTIRSLIRFAFKNSSSYSWLANRFRVFGIVGLQINGVKFKMYAEGDDFIVNELYYNLNYEIEEFLLVKELCQKSDCFIDVGANTGIFSIYSKVSNPGLNVIAIEPHPVNFKRLIKNINLNGITLDCKQLAAGNDNREIQFTIPSNDSIATTASVNREFATNFKNIEHTTIVVKQITLDSLLEHKLTSSDLLKIDVEYYEKEVLSGLQKILHNVKPFVILEILDYDSLIRQFPHMAGKLSPNHSKDINDLMTSAGYFSYQIREDGIQLQASNKKKSDRRNYLFAPAYCKNFIPWGKIHENLSPPVNLV